MTATTLRRTARRLTGTTIVAGTLLLGGGAAQAESIESITDEYLYDTSLSQFAQVREERLHDDRLDWSTDACSWSPDEPFGFDFTPGCYRHDFGYRNYKDQDRFTEASRRRIDDNFYADLKDICGGNSACNATAWTYYQAVRQFGAS